VTDGGQRSPCGRPASKADARFRWRRIGRPAFVKNTSQVSATRFRIAQPIALTGAWRQRLRGTGSQQGQSWVLGVMGSPPFAAGSPPCYQEARGLV
jgi:hypothetical protein